MICGTLAAVCLTSFRGYYSSVWWAGRMQRVYLADSSGLLLKIEQLSAETAASRQCALNTKQLSSEKDLERVEISTCWFDAVSDRKAEGGCSSQTSLNGHPARPRRWINLKGILVSKCWQALCSSSCFLLKSQWSQLKSHFPGRSALLKTRTEVTFKGEQQPNCLECAVLWLPKQWPTQFEVWLLRLR